jgi:uncharacterized protein (TIGR02246 family)
MGEIMCETKLARSSARWLTASSGSNRMLMNMSCVQRALLLVAAVGVMGACESPEQRPGESALADTTGVRASIDSLAANVMRAEQTGDAELFASTWARNGIMSLPGSPPVHGRDSIVAAFRRQPPLPSGAKMTIHPTELQILNREWAYVMGVDTLTYTPQGSAAPVKETSTFLAVLRKTGEGWQTYREVLSANQTKD